MRRVSRVGEKFEHLFFPSLSISSSIVLQKASPAQTSAEGPGTPRYVAVPKPHLSFAPCCSSWPDVHSCQQIRQGSWETGCYPWKEHCRKVFSLPSSVQVSYLGEEVQKFLFSGLREIQRAVAHPIVPNTKIFLLTIILSR